MFGQRARLKRPCSMSKPSPLLQGLSCRRGQFLDNEHGHLNVGGVVKMKKSHTGFLMLHVVIQNIFRQFKYDFLTKIS